MLPCSVQCFTSQSIDHVFALEPISDTLIREKICVWIDNQEGIHNNRFHVHTNFVATTLNTWTLQFTN